MLPTSMVHDWVESRHWPTEPKAVGEVRVPEWYDAAHFRDAEVTLKPLHAEHAGAWLTQTRDPRIAELTRLPDFQTIHELENWLRERWVATVQPLDRSQRQLLSFALVHDQWGFIGSVALYTLGVCGCFHFWVGADYQGRGFGKRAVGLLRRVAPLCLHVHELFTAVYETNTRSQRVLSSSGLSQLPFRATTSDGRALLYRSSRKGESVQDERVLYSRLTALFEELGSDLVIEDDTRETEIRTTKPAPNVQKPHAPSRHESPLT